MTLVQNNNEGKPVIWYLHHYAGSPNLGMAYRPYYLSLEFNKKGFSSFVIGASFHHLKKNAIEQIKPIEAETVDGQPFIWLRTPTYEGNGFGRIKNMISYAWGLWRHRKELVKKTGSPSIIIVSSGHPFHYMPALLLKKIYKAKIIFEVRDLWPLSFTELLNIPKYHPFVLLLSFIEKLAYRTTDHLVSLLPNALPYMQKCGLKKEKYHYIPNGIAVSHSLRDRLPLPEYHQNAINKQKTQNSFLIGYAGAHGIPNALDDLICAMALLKQEGFTQARLVLIGQGEQKKNLQQLVKDYNLNTVIFLDPILKNQVFSFLDQMDIVYLGWKDKPIYRFGISPNKIFEYMMAAKPILQATSSLYDLISEIGCGLSVEAQNPQEIAKGIKQLASLKKDALVKMGELGAQAVRLKYDYERLANDYIALF